MICIICRAMVGCQTLGAGPYKQERAIKSKPRTWNNIICTTRWYAPKLGESADHAQILPVCLLLVNPRILPCSVNFWCIPSEEITSKKSSNIVSLYFCYKHDTYSLVKKQIMWIGKKRRHRDSSAN